MVRFTRKVVQNLEKNKKIDHFFGIRARLGSQKPYIVTFVTVNVIVMNTATATRHIVHKTCTTTHEIKARIECLCYSLLWGGGLELGLMAR